MYNVLTGSSSPEPTDHVCLVISYHCHLAWLQPPLPTDMKHWSRVRFTRLKVTSYHLKYININRKSSLGHWSTLHKSV